MKSAASADFPDPGRGYRLSRRRVDAASGMRISAKRSAIPTSPATDVSESLMFESNALPRRIA
jgi:hypothetical protein